MTRWKGILFLAAAGSCLAACGGGNCTSIYAVPAYSIKVIDAKTQAPICDATVSVGSQPATSVNCAYHAPITASEKSMTLTVEHAGYQTFSEQLSTHYNSDSCGHALPVNVSVSLTPTS